MTVIKNFTLPPDPFGVVKGQIIKFRNYSVSYQYFYFLHADKGTINMKHIKCDFPMKACVSPSGWTLGVGSEGQNSTFSQLGHDAYQIKGNQQCSSLVANILLADSYPSPHLT